VNFTMFLTILIMVESGGNQNAIGDIHMTNKAYGILQIRQPYLTDANRIAGTNYTMEEIKNSRALSKWCAVTYMRHYGEIYKRKTGKEPTFEILARIHNGGPNGWKKDSTLQYIDKCYRVQKSLDIDILTQKLE
jgi:hypothetical protein